MRRFNKKNIFLIMCGIIGVICMIIYYVYSNNFSSYEVLENTIIESNNSKNETIKEEKSKIIIHIAGCVTNPGVIQLEENSRISDAIDKAGGLTEDGDISQINLAYSLEDGMKIYIPSHTEIEEEKRMESSKNEYNIATNEKEVKNTNQKENYVLKSNSTSKGEVSNNKVNINTATKNELENLPGIGSATADKIIEYRDQNGKFKQIEDLKQVKGIGENKFEKVKDLITIK